MDKNYHLVCLDDDTQQVIFEGNYATELGAMRKGSNVCKNYKPDYQILNDQICTCKRVRCVITLSNKDGLHVLKNFLIAGKR